MDISPVVAALSRDTVYIANGASDSPTIHDDLSQLLQGTDGIRIAVLPKTDTGALESMAAQVEAKMPQGTTVILIRGDEVAAVSTSVSSSVTQGMLQRAENVSTNSLDTVRTFVGNVHDYQAEHPQTVTSTEVANTPWFFTPPAIIGGSVGIPSIVTAVVVLVAVAKKRRRLSPRVAGTAPREVRPIIQRVMEQREAIRSGAMRASLENLCEYTEAYFKRNKDGSGVDRLRVQLDEALQIAQTFRAIESEPKYYTKPVAQMDDGQQAIQGLAESVLQSVRSGNDRALMNYRINTKTLGAEKYR